MPFFVDGLTPAQRKTALVLVVVILLGIVAIVVMSLGLFPSMGRWFSSSISTTEEAVPEGPSAPAVYAHAFARAKSWQTDAKLSYLIGEDGIAWKLIFTSQNPAAHGQGYLVIMQGQDVVGAEAIAYTGPAADFPIADIITADEAVARVRAMSGYEDAEVEGIEAVYGPSEEVWYWGVRTSKGVVTVEAKRR